MPYGIERLKSLHILKGVCLYKSSVETIQGLGKLTNLRNLGINSHFPTESRNVAYARMNALHSSISSLSTSLRILTLHAYLPGHDMEYWNRTLFPQGSHIRKLHLSGYSFYRCPEWIGQLHDLYSLTITVIEVADSISIVEGLTSLAYFELSTDTYRYRKEKECIVISGGRAFQALKHLIFHCPKVLLIFEVGALPKLEKLEIMFCHLTHHISLLAVGIEHLPAPTLEQIIIKVTRDLNYADFNITINDWDDNYWECAYDSDQETNSLIKQLRKLRSVLKRAFKKHHPGADIYIEFESYSYDPSQKKERYRSDEEAESVVDDEYDEGAHQVNGSQTAAQVQTNTRQLLELIEAQEDSARMSINIDAPLMVGTSIHLAVGLEGWQGGRGSQDLAVLESSEQPSTSLLAPLPSSIPLFAWADTAEPMANFSVDININNDLLVQQGNDGMLVNTVGQYLDLNQQAHARELFDLNHASSADSESLQLPFRSLLAPSSSSLHHTLELSLWPDAAETERDYLNPAPNEITDEEFFVD